MTQQVEDQVPRAQYVATAAQTVFPYPFQIFVSGDITVEQNGVELVLTTDYVLSDVGNINGGNVTLLTGASSGDLITIYRSMEFARDTDYQEGGDFLANTVDNDFNRLWLALQQNREGLSRTLQYDTNDIAGTESLPFLEVRKDTALGFDSNGEPIALNILTSTPAIGAVYSNVAAMKLGALEVGARAATNVYHSEGGGSAYEVVAPEAADNQINIILNNGNIAKLLLVGDTIHASQAGALFASVIGPDDAAFAALDAQTAFDYVDMEGKETHLTLSSVNYDGVDYINGTVWVKNGDFETRMPRHRSDQDYEVARPRTKTPELDWKDKTILWLGTSIPAQGQSTETSYPHFAGDALAVKLVRNRGWASSHAYFNYADSAFLISTVSALSMTERDRIRGETEFGPTSAYNEDFDPITKARSMTVDYRISETGFQIEHQDVVVLDHNHNDIFEGEGELTPASTPIQGVTIGGNTLFDMLEGHGVELWDNVIMRVEGIQQLDYAAGTVTGVTSTAVIISDINSGAFTGTFISGEMTVVDKSTIFGSWNFLISYILNQSILYGDVAAQPPTTKIILAGAPSNFTGNALSRKIYSIAESLKIMATKWDLSFFDIGFLYDIKLHDNPIFFEDGIHPRSVETRHALANYWAEWMSGGSSLTIDPRTILPAVSQDYLDNNAATYTEISGGFSTPDALLEEGTQQLLEDWKSGFGTWTQTGDSTTIVSAPWTGTDNALFCQADFSVNDQAFVEDDIFALGEHPRWEMDIEWPVVSGVTTKDIATVSILHMDIGNTGDTNGFCYLLQAVPTPTSIGLQFAYFTAPSGTGGEEFIIISIPGFTFEANTKYHIELQVTKALTAETFGSVLVKINDEVVMRKFEGLDNFNQVATNRVACGILSSGTDADLAVYVSNFDEHAQTFIDFSTRFTGEQGGITYVAGVAVSAGPFSFPTGNFTPIAIASAGSGTITYNLQEGAYTEIGDTVYVQGILNVSSWASRTGTIKLSGLPFTLLGGSNGAPGLIVSQALLLTITASESLVLDGNTGTNEFRLSIWNATTGTFGATIAADCPTGLVINFSGSYKKS